MGKKVIIILIVVVAALLVVFAARSAFEAINTEMSADKVKIEAIRLSPELNAEAKTVHMVLEMDLQNESNHMLENGQLPYYVVTGARVLPRTDTNLPATDNMVQEEQESNLLVLEQGDKKTAYYVFDVNMSGSVTLVFPNDVTVTGADPDEVWKTIATTVRDTLNSGVQAAETSQQQSSEKKETTEAQGNAANGMTPENAVALTYSQLPQKLGSDVMGGRELVQVSAGAADDNGAVVTGHLRPTATSENKKDSTFTVVYNQLGGMTELYVDDVDLLHVGQ